jgi:hypothetical protein
MTDTCDIQLPLAGDAFLDVDDPQRLILHPFEFQWSIDEYIFLNNA